MPMRYFKDTLGTLGRVGRIEATPLTGHGLRVLTTEIDSFLVPFSSNILTMAQTRRRRGTRTRKMRPWKGWGKDSPNIHARTNMMAHCPNSCFLGAKKTFPICKRGTCKISTKGVYSAYIRARQYSSKGAKYKRVAARARRMIDDINS